MSNSNNEKKSAGKRIAIRWVMMVAVALLAGAAGQLATFNYLFSTYKAPVQTIIRQDPVDLPGEIIEQGDILRAVEHHVAIYATDHMDASEYLFENEALGRGVVLTNDGWILAPRSVFEQIEQLEAYSVMTSDRESYAIEELVEDPRTPLVFLKISAGDLHVASFGDSDRLALGQPLWSVSAGRELFLGTLAHLDYAPSESAEDIQHESEELYSGLLVSTSDHSAANGSSVSDLDAKVVGIMIDQGLAVPANSVKRSLESILRTGSIDAPYLGIAFIDLSQAVRTDQDVMPGNGALIVSVDAQSPAGEAGLEAGDIILQVEQDHVDPSQTLSQLLDSYDPGQTVTISVLREQDESLVEVTLGSLEEVIE